MFGVPEIKETMSKLFVGWMGQVARAGASNLAFIAHAWRDAGWWRDNKDKVDRPRYSKRGSHKSQASDGFFAEVGPEWPVVAQDRVVWRALWTAAAPTEAASVKGMYFNPMKSNKLADFLRCKLPRSVNKHQPICFISDNQALVMAAVGRAAVSGDVDLYARAGLRGMRWLFYPLEYRLPFCPAFRRWA